MDPISGIGLALGIVPLFSVCLEYFEYFKTAQSLLSDFEVLLLKLDFEHERFIAWGEVNGISKTIEEGRNCELDNPQKADLIKRSLESIQSLFKNSERLQTKYGVQALNTPSSGGPTPKFPGSFGLSRFRKSYKRLNKSTEGEKTLSVLSKTKWAIHDKGKFEILISDIRDLVNGLYHTLPVSNKERDMVAFKDIKCLLPDLTRLKLVELASEDVYPTWSQAASVMIMASEPGTVDGRGRVGEWVEEVDDSEEGEPEAKSNNSPQKASAQGNLFSQLSS